MKNIKHKFIVFTSIVLFTAIHSDLNSFKTASSYPLEWRVYADELQEYGHSKQSAEQIAKKAFNIKN